MTNFDEFWWIISTLVCRFLTFISSIDTYSYVWWQFQHTFPASWLIDWMWKMHTSMEIIHQNSSKLVNDAQPSVSKPLHFFYAWKVRWNCHQTLLLVSIDDMKMWNIISSVDIIHQISLKLVNDTPLMSLQSERLCIFSVQGRFGEIGIKHDY